MNIFRRIVKWIVLVGLMCMPFAVHADETLEAKVKAAYLFHLIKFVDWPSLPPDDIRICVYGSTSIGGMLNELADRQVKEHALKIFQNNPGDMMSCQVVFIGRGEKRWHALLDKVDGMSILTVSDLDEFAHQGGMVGFYADGGKIKLEINPSVARNSNLRISSKLLELARTVSSSQE